MWCINDNNLEGIWFSINLFINFAIVNQAYRIKELDSMEQNVDETLANRNVSLENK